MSQDKDFGSEKDLSEVSKKIFGSGTIATIEPVFDETTNTYTIQQDGIYTVGGQIRDLKKGDVIKMPDKKESADKKPMLAAQYQRLSAEEKLKYFPVNRAMRRKQGIR